MTDYTHTRRRFLTQAAIAVTALPFLGVAGRAEATPLKPLPETHPQAKALSYVADVARSKHAALKPGSKCANCQFFTAATGACTLFAGFSVPPKAWCAAWAKKAA